MTAEVVLALTANSFVKTLSEDLHLFAGLSAAQDFFELWEAQHVSVVAAFDDEHVRDSFQHADFKLMRTAAFTNQTLWDALM